MGGVRFNARENGQISPSTTVWASGGAGNRRHLASVLQEGRNRRMVTPVRESSGNPGLEEYLRRPGVAPLLVILFWACAVLPNLTVRSFVYEEGTNAEIARDILA